MIQLLYQRHLGSSEYTTHHLPPVYFLSDFRASSCILILIISLLFGCEEIKNLKLDELLGEDCEESAMSLATALGEEGQISTEIAEEPPFPMSIIVSQDALNQLFSSITDNEIDPITLNVGSVLGVDVSVTVSPDLPLIQIESVEDCETCIVTQVSFGLAVSAAGFSIGAEGTARYQFPVRMQPEGLEATHVFGDFDQSQFQTLDLRVTDDADFEIPFVDITVNDLIDLAEPDVKDYVNELVQDEYGAVELFTLEPWVIGNGEVKLLGRGPLLFPEHRTLVMGIHTNLVQPLSSSVSLEPILPEGADLGMQFHPELIQVMVQRMMHEGHIGRTYDESGSAMMSSESDGLETSFEVTLSTLEQSSERDGLLSAGFTMWRTEDGICGSAELRAELGAQVGDGGVRLVAQNIRIERGEGLFGFLAETADDWLQSDFMREVINVSEFTLNYDELNLPNNKKAQMSAENFRFEVGGSGFNIFLNLDAVVDREVDETESQSTDR